MDHLQASQHTRGQMAVASRELLTLESSERLSSGISLHTFSVSGSGIRPPVHPSGHIELLFLEDLDPTRPSTGEADRRLTFTPAYAKRDSQNSHHSILVLSRNGRVAQLLGLPRLQGPLRAEVVSVGGGFSEETLRNLEGAIGIASGTGLAPFLAIASEGYDTVGCHLFWTINGNDFGAVEQLIKSELLSPEDWASVNIFVTSGDEMPDIIAGKSMPWWENKFANLTQAVGGNAKFKCGRMAQNDLLGSQLTRTTAVYFCGNKSLEWQVKMWFLNKARVYTTSIE